ncbi:hypothetical protein M441DRAFT_72636 [Trichoderma asperellum CBS 433.97]|uniref:Fungal STAND N-terminal Goodbye domain-containing protein n=1 Tax=Trichoderma asperellum (strain ATCC 204424 / CBS 433.97 / NBRC 101777) TaxID=1042311 RepID=A0A2T3YXV3_TRIA4|nr:hypothetical protein M441DRAFT_72636 [Trichoderma asperellum CBS 433.97]PTB37354.1 hypothetical protein M441DRAFT_72636 [Trichoderma asperellum CBS 433.97]
MREIMSNGREIQVMKGWSQTEGAAVHQGLASPTEYSSQRAEWRVPINRKVEDLSAAIESLQPGDSTTSPQEVSWKDVFNSIEEAKNTYEKKVEDNRFRGWIRKGDVAIDILERLSEAIPDENGLSVLKTGLVFIFQSCRKRLSNVGNILQELDDAPGVLASVYQICDVYREEIRLKNLVWDFYGILVDCLSELLTILNRTYKDANVFKKFVKQIPEVEAAKIGEISKRINKAKQAVFEATAHLDRQVWQETKASAQQGRIAAEATRKTAHDIKARVANLQQETSEGHYKLSSQVDQFRSQMIESANQMGDQLAQTKRQIAKEGEERKQFEAGLQRLVDALPASIHEQLQSALYQFVADSIVQRQLFALPPNIISPYPASQPLVQYAPALSEGDIINLLQTPDPIGDADRILRKESLMSDEALGYATLLRQKRQFKEWLSADWPSLVLVDGCSRGESVGRTSPMSYFTASFASTLIQAQTGIVLQFFCGHHTDPQKENSGPKGLLRSIISQLLLYPKSYNLSLNFVDQSLYDAVAASNTEALCFFFERLFWQIQPDTIIYVLVDSISDFESDLHDYGERMDRVLILFQTLIRQVLQGFAAGPKLKLFMTSPNRSHRLIYRVDQAKESIRLNAAGLGDIRGGGDRLMREIRRAKSPQPLIY